MASKIKPQKKNLDVTQLAHRVVEWATTPREDRPPEARGPRQKNAKKAAAGKKGGKLGGAARAKSLTSRKRKAIAKKAARSRWE